MLKYIILTFSLQLPLHCMDSLIIYEPHNSFKNLNVLDYDGYENNALYIAQTAKTVHSNTKKKDINTINITQKKYANIKNLLFTEPQENMYDLITIYDPYILNKQNIVIHLYDIHNYLKPSGKLYALIRTQTNSISPPEIIFSKLYLKIHQSTHYELQQKMNSLDNSFIIHSQSHYLTDAELKEIIYSRGYHILSYKNKTYEPIIQNIEEYQQSLKLAFINAISKSHLSKETQEHLSSQFAERVTNECKKNNLNLLIESWNFTKIKLSKTDNPRPPIYINNSLLSEDYLKL